MQACRTYKRFNFLHQTQKLFMKLYIFFMAAIAMLAMSCGNAENKQAYEAADSAAAYISNEQQTTGAESMADTLILPPDSAIQQGNAALLPQAGAPAVADWDKKLIKTADITLQVNNYDSFDNALHRQLITFGAYIATEKQTGSGAHAENDVTVKVPVYQFEALLSSLNGKGIVIQNKEITTTEVTGELADTKARMETKKLVRERYMELMGNAKNMKDVLTVQQELNSLQENIEATHGRVNYLQHQAAYSTIHLKYYQQTVGVPEVAVTVGYLARLVKALADGAAVVGDILLFIVTIWPLTVLGVIAWVLYKKKWGNWKEDKQV